uniref:mucin-3A-like n=1 Tax=Panthera onca TaxID=9690 RepID=UPI002952FB83|nr:mucin-3A-like [Panthera onca]
MKQPANESLCSLVNTGTFPTAASTSAELLPRAGVAHTALSNSPRSKSTARWPLTIPSRASPAANSRERTLKISTTSPYFKPISEAVLKTTVKTNTSTILMSKFVIKVETTPPTLIVSTSTIKCINPTSLIITTAYPATTCMTPTTTKRLTSAMISPPMTITTLGKMLTAMALLSSSVPTTHTNFHMPTSSTTGNTNRISLTTASIHTTRCLTPIIASTSSAPSLTATNISETVTDHNSSPIASTISIMTTTSLPNTTVTFKTATTHDPTQSVSASTEVTATLRTPTTIALETMSSTEMKLTLMSDTGRETLMTETPSTSPGMSSITPRNTTVSATSTTSETTLEPTTTHMTFTTTEPPFSTAATTHTGKTTITPHATPPGKPHLFLHRTFPQCLS